MFDNKLKMMSIFYAHNPVNLIATHVLTILTTSLAIYYRMNILGVQLRTLTMYNPLTLVSKYG